MGLRTRVYGATGCSNRKDAVSRSDISAPGPARQRPGPTTDATDAANAAIDADDGNGTTTAPAQRHLRAQPAEQPGLQHGRPATDDDADDADDAATQRMGRQRREEPTDEEM